MHLFRRNKGDDRGDRYYDRSSTESYSGYYQRRKNPDIRDNESILNEYRRDTQEAAVTTTSQLEGLQLNQEIQEQERMRRDIEFMLDRYESLGKGIHSSEGNGATKRQLKHRINQNIKDLKKMGKDLGKHEYSNLDVYKNRLGELMYYFEHYENVRQLIVLGGRTSNIHAIIDSKRDAKRARRYEEKDARYQQEMNEILHDVALTSMWNDDMESYEEYLKLVVNGQLEPSQHPFYTKHIWSINLIRCINPSLYEALVPSRKKKKQDTRHEEGGVTTGGNVPGVVAPGTVVPGETNPCPTPEDSKPFYSRIGGKLGGYISDLLSNFVPGMDARDPRQKRAWEGFGTALTIGGSIFMGYEVVKNLFSDKGNNPNKRKKAAAWAAGGIALMNGDKLAGGLIDWVKDAFGYHPAEKIQVANDIFNTYGFSDTAALNIADVYVGAPVATISALHFIPIYELKSQNILQYQNNRFVFNNSNYRQYIDNHYQWTDEQKQIVFGAGDNLSKNDAINIGLSALGLETMDDVDRIAGSDTSKTLVDDPKVQENYKQCAERVKSGVNGKLYKQGLIPKDQESANQIISEYESNGGDEMESDKLDELMIKWMKDGLVKINGENVKYKLEEILEDENIDLEKKTMKGFTNSLGNEIEFSSYKELFDAVNLTNWIKQNFKGRDARTEEPFHVSTTCIQFDNKEWYEIFANEPDVLSKRTMIDSFPTLWNNSTHYVEYLNRWWKDEGMDKIDLTNYPELKILSEAVGMNFTDMSEAQVTEELLETIKKDRFRRISDRPAPFKVGRDVLKLSGGYEWFKIVFTDANGQEIQLNLDDFHGSKYKKLLYDEDSRKKFENFLNDPNNEYFTPAA